MSAQKRKKGWSAFTYVDPTSTLPEEICLVPSPASLAAFSKDSSLIRSWPWQTVSSCEVDEGAEDEYDVLVIYIEGSSFQFEIEYASTLLAAMREFSEAANDDQSLKSQLDQFVAGRFARRVVPNDNSCLFHSVIYCLKSGRKGLPSAKLTPDSLRKICADTVVEDSDTYPEFVLGRSSGEYANWILDPFNWGGEIELRVLSSHFETQICVVPLQEGMKRVIYGDESTQQYRERMFLEYNGSHYNVLGWQIDGDGDSQANSCSRSCDSVYLVPTVHSAGSVRWRAECDSTMARLMQLADAFAEANKHLAKTSNSNVDLEKEGEQVFTYLLADSGAEVLQLRKDLESRNDTGKVKQKSRKKAPQEKAEWKWGNDVGAKLEDFGFEAAQTSGLLSEMQRAANDTGQVQKPMFIRSYTTWKKSWNNKYVL